MFWGYDSRYINKYMGGVRVFMRDNTFAQVHGVYTPWGITGESKMCCKVYG